MGCGQSKIHLYPRKSKSKANGKKSGHIDVDADADEEEGHIVNENEKEINKDKDRMEDDTLSNEQLSPEQPNSEISISLMRAKNLSLLQSQEISSSQQNFFRMLDQKIDDGPDYDSSSETEMALEEARLNALVQHWESASLTASLCSSASRSLQGTPVRQITSRQPPLRAQIQQPLNVEMLSQHQHIQKQQIKPNISPRRDGRSSMLPPNIIQQTFGLTATQQQQQQQQQQQSNTSIVGNSSTTSISPGVIGINAGNISGGSAIIRQRGAVVNVSGSSSIGVANVNPNIVGNMLPQHLPMAYYGQSTPPQQSYFGEVLHPMQVPQTQTEPRFPQTISVQRLAPQVQRQLRETQEMIKDSCPQLYAAGFGSPAPPIRSQQRPPNRRPTPLETQFSQELS